MLKMNYIGQNEVYDVECKKVSPHILQLTGAFPIKRLGFKLSRHGKKDNWDRSEYKTVYREIEGGVQFSDDKSVYIAPPEPEPIPEPEPYVPTIEEFKEMKKNDIRAAYENTVAAGFSVELSTGTEQFPLSNDEITFLMGKQLEMAGSDAEQISYQNNMGRCKFYSREDMQIIINTALKFVNFQTTYRNNLIEWADECQTKEELEAINYGVAIPSEFQNEVYRSYMSEEE